MNLILDFILQTLLVLYQTRLLLTCNDLGLDMIIEINGLILMLCGPSLFALMLTVIPLRPGNVALDGAHVHFLGPHHVLLVMNAATILQYRVVLRLPWILRVLLIRLVWFYIDFYLFLLNFSNSFFL